MQEIKIGNDVIVLYEDIEELPVRNFQKFNKFILVDSGVGSDVAAINNRIARTSGFIKAKKEKEAYAELENLRKSMFLVAEEISPEHLSFTCLISKINGKSFEWKSDADLERTSKALGDIKIGLVRRILNTFKKKVESDLQEYFPKRFNAVSLREQFDKLKKKSLLILDGIIEKNIPTEAIEKIDMYLLMLNKPQVFTGPKGAEVIYDKSFEQLCVYLTDKTSVSMENATTRQFYNALDYAEAKTKNG